MTCSIHLNDSNYSMFSMKKWSLIFNICLHIMFQTGKRFEIFRGKVRTERAQRRRSVTAFHHEYWIKFCLASFGRFVIWYKNVAAHYAQTCHVSNSYKRLNLKQFLKFVLIKGNNINDNENLFCQLCPVFIIYTMIISFLVAQLQTVKDTTM